MEFLLVPHMAMEYWENILVRLVSFFFMVSSSFYSMLFLEWAQKNKQTKEKKNEVIELCNYITIHLELFFSSFSSAQFLLWRRPKVMYYPHFCYHELMNSQL